ncbi:MAG TPA: zinc ribbon domain-containing protein [Anaerolineae bacterium]
MPLYEFECQTCGENFDRLMRATDVIEVTCPECGSQETLKKFSTFAAPSKSGTLSALNTGATTACAPGGT